MTAIDLKGAREPDAAGHPLRSGSGKTEREVRAAWLGARVAGGGVIVLFFAYLRLARLMPTISDGASQALQAWAMLHGNVLLHGWSLSDVSFYTTELPEYMLVELVRGLTPDVVHVAAALTYTLLVLLAALLAKGAATGRAGAIRGAGGGGHHARSDAGHAQHDVRGAVLSRSHRHTGAAAGGLAADRSAQAALVGTGTDRGAASRGFRSPTRWRCTRRRSRWQPSARCALYRRRGPL